jgi:rod shape-determining protein MreD
VKVALRLGVVLLSAAVLQRGLFAQLRIADASADVFLLLAIAGGMVNGPDRGAVFGFFSGLALDLLVPTPLGLSALTYCLIGYLAGRLQGSVRRSNRLFPPLLAASLGAGGVLLYAVLAAVLGQSSAVSTQLMSIMVVVAVANALLSPLALRVARWTWPDEQALRPVLR